MYKLYVTTLNQNGIIRYNDNGSTTSFFFNPDNTDYQKFKINLTEGVELQDAEGDAMTAEQIQSFLQGLN
jgi:hypothetical protein